MARFPEIKRLRNSSDRNSIEPYKFISSSRLIRELGTTSYQLKKMMSRKIITPLLGSNAYGGHTYLFRESDIIKGRQFLAGLVDA